MGDFIVKITKKWRFLAGKMEVLLGKWRFYWENGGFTGKMMENVPFNWEIPAGYLI